MMDRKLLFLLSIISLCALFESCKRNVDFDPNDLVDERDGQRYATINFGQQRWMAQNLNYNLAASQLNPSNPFGEFGRLYSFEQAKTICPDGWHLPTDAEWRTMEYEIGLSANELETKGYRGGVLGRELKSTTEWLLKNGTNTLNFNVYPAGIYNPSTAAFEELGKRAYLWTASDSSSQKGWYRALTKDFDGIYREAGYKQEFYSCRCVMD